MTARDEILARVRTARAVKPVEPSIPRDYHGAGDIQIEDRLGLLAERLEDYHARVRRCAPDELVSTIASALTERRVARVVVPPGLPESWVSAVADPVRDQPPLTPDELDGVDGVLTTVTVAIALTGTLVLDAGDGQGRRVLTLVPDYHLAVVPAERVVASVPDAVGALDPTRPQTWVSGPSATSDIELSRVEGVHGPRTLEVILVG